MGTWISIPVVERRQWVEEIQGISADSHIQCFILASTRGYDGPWTDLLFVLDPAYPEALTVYFARIHEQALEGGFNPLDGGGGISLTEEEGYDLAALLESHVGTLVESQAITAPAFQLLKKEEYADLHVFSIASSHNSVEEYFYRQLRLQDTLAGDAIISIVEFGKDRTQPHAGVWFQAMQFRGSQLQEPSFRPNDYALPRITLDRNDIRSLVGLFHKHLA